MENIRYIWGDIIADVFVPWGMGKTLPEAESAERFPQQAACRLFPWKRGTDWRIAQPQTEARGVLGRSWHSYNERLLARHNIGNIGAYALRPFHYFHRLDTAFLHFQSGFQAFSFDIKYFPQNNALNFAIFKTFGIFGAILKPNTQKAHGSARLDWVKNGTHEIRVLN